MGHSGTGLKFSITIDFQIFKTFFIHSKNDQLKIKNMSKIFTLDLNQEGFFSNFALYSKNCHFSITSFDILMFCNIQHLKIIFGRFYYETIFFS